MFEKRCRLSEAARCDKGGGGGSSGQGIIFSQPSTENKTLGNWFNTQFGRESDFQSNNPLLNAATGAALHYNAQMPGMLKQMQSFLGAPGGAYQTAASGGALGGEALRNAQQQSLGLQSAGGVARTSGGMANAVLNADAQRQARYNTSLAQSESGMQQAQGFQTTGLNQLLGVGNAAVSQYTNLTDPIFSYLNSLYRGNQAASVSQAQIQQAGQNASDSKKAGGTSAIGSIAGAAIVAL